MTIFKTPKNAQKPDFVHTHTHTHTHTHVVFAEKFLRCAQETFTTVFAKRWFTYFYIK